MSFDLDLAVAVFVLVYATTIAAAVGIRFLAQRAIAHGAESSTSSWKPRVEGSAAGATQRPPVLTDTDSSIRRGRPTSSSRTQATEDSGDGEVGTVPASEADREPLPRDGQLRRRQPCDDPASSVAFGWWRL